MYENANNEEGAFSTGPSSNMNNNTLGENTEISKGLQGFVKLTE